MPPDITAMLQEILKNPEAKTMLAGLVGARESEDDTAPPLPSVEEPSSKDEKDTVPTVARAYPTQDKKGQARQAVLLAIRPYLGTRRCASLDRLLRAMELYRLIEDTKLMQGNLPSLMGMLTKS